MREREIRASFDERTIRVYQAYGDAIADSALAEGTFVTPPFKMDRMTWIKPSFLWMMYRSGWGTKPGQERVLAIDITRDGFEWALYHSCLSHFDPRVYSSREKWQELRNQAPVLIQWDPERDMHMNRLEYRSLQIGLSSEAVYGYVQEWIQHIEDCTAMVAKLREASGQERHKMLPNETLYSLSQVLSKLIGCQV